jgi:diaminopimelate decarboxylase
VAIRINPDVTPGTHHYITTGSKQNKFGIDTVTSEKLFRDSAKYPYLSLAGIHIHIGSQITKPAPFVEAVSKCLDFIDRVGRVGRPIEYLNIGGGLGIIYSDEKPQTADQFASVIVPLIRKRNPDLKLILEPGRFVSGNSGILVTRVIYRKKSPTKSFLIVDAAMNDLIRPSFYGAYHEIAPVNRALRRGKPEKMDIVGPVCESGDFLAKDRKLAPAEPGDLLAVFSCGAYGFVMSSNYNSRPRAPEVVVKGSKFFVARRRETMDDLLRVERIVVEAAR